jgi:uncharacterized protein with PIN domain
VQLWIELCYFIAMQNRFVADVHLGKLARLLRLLGLDTTYQNNFTNAELIKIAVAEDRVLLSRNTGLSTNACIRSFLVTDEDPLRQLRQVVEHFDLKDQFRPFSRCLVCNGTLEPVSKKSVFYLLQKNTADYFNEFWQCNNCKRIYWKGSHYEKMLKTIKCAAS